MPSTATLPAVEMPCHDRYDVIVVGGGPAGCTAATAAARAGARTLLIEATGALGGAGTNSLVPAWCPFSDHREQIYRGLAQEVFSRCKQGTFGVEPDALDWVPIDAEWLKQVYDHLVASAGAELRFHTQLVRVLTDGRGGVEGIVTASKAGLECWCAPVFIDCSGDGDLCAWAGARFQKGDGIDGSLQPVTLCFRLGNVDPEAFARGPYLHPANPRSPIYRILADRRHPLIPDSFINCVVVGPGSVGFNAGRIWGIDGSDPDALSRAMVTGRRMARAYRDALAEYVPEVYGRAFLESTGATVGVRETRRILGDYLLTVEDWIARRTFPDEICRNAYYLDVHPSVAKTIPEEHLRYAPGDQHGVPYRCLCPADLRNVLVAGRCVSADRQVQGSVRVMPVCLAMGEAAGTAAAMASRSDGDVHAVDVPALRTALRAAGAYLPDATCAEPAP